LGGTIGERGRKRTEPAVDGFGHRFGAGVEGRFQQFQAAVDGFVERSELAVERGVQIGDAAAKRGFDCSRRWSSEAVISPPFEVRRVSKLST